MGGGKNSCIPKGHSHIQHLKRTYHVTNYFEDIACYMPQMEEAFAFWGTPEGDLGHPPECMQQLLEKVRRHRVNVDGNVCTHCHGNHFGS
ncbi:hypothetical protein ACE6H2_021585 [Prunus campanulata]